MPTSFQNLPDFRAILLNNIENINQIEVINFKTYH